MSKFPGRNWKLTSLSKLKQTSGIYIDKTMTEKYLHKIHTLHFLMCCRVLKKLSLHNLQPLYNIIYTIFWTNTFL